MFARLYIPLAFYATVRPDDEYEPIIVERGDYTFTISPPHKSQLLPTDVHFAYGLPVFEQGRRLRPMDDPPTPIWVDDRPAVLGDALMVEIHGPLERATGIDKEPAIPSAFEVVNSYLRWLKVLSQGAYVQEASIEDPWFLVYHDDDGSEFEIDPTGQLVRHRGLSRFRVPSMTVLVPSLWDAARDLISDNMPPAWETLLLDARRLLPDVGPAIVLAATAVEVRLNKALDALATRHGEPVDSLWRYMSERERFWTEPSVADKASDVFKAIGGDSLKDDELWPLFQNLRSARNSYVHRGLARMGGSETAELVDYAKAVSLIDAARRIIDWIETHLPEDERRPQYAEPHTLGVAIPVDIALGQSPPADEA